MKRLIIFVLGAMLSLPASVLAHQENHLFSQWIKQRFWQMEQKMRQLKARVDRLEQAGQQRQALTPKPPMQQPPMQGHPMQRRAPMGRPFPMQAGDKNYLNERCGPNEQKLCQKACPQGWNIGQTVCNGQGAIAKAYYPGGRVSCYCFNQNDPNCRIDSVTAACLRP